MPPGETYTSDPTATPGCQGFIQGGLLTVVGGFGHDPNITITQNNPETSQNANIGPMAVTENTSPHNDGGPWPYFLVFPTTTFTITSGNNAIPSCTETVTAISASQQLTMTGTCNCNTNNTCFY